MAFVNGHTGDVTIGGTAMRVKKWSATLKQDEIDVTRRGDQGWRAYTTGLRGIEGSLEFDYDTAIHATGGLPAPFAITPATFVLDMNDGTNDGLAFNFTGYVFEVSFDSPVDGIISCSANFKSSSVVTYS